VQVESLVLKQDLPLKHGKGKNTDKTLFSEKMSFENEIR
jgi:hypothetical protein